MTALSEKVGISAYDSQKSYTRKNILKTNTVDVSHAASNIPSTKIARKCKVFSESDTTGDTKRFTNNPLERTRKFHARSQSFDAQIKRNVFGSDKSMNKNNVGSMNDQSDCKTYSKLSNKKNNYFNSNDDDKMETKSKPKCSNDSSVNNNNRPTLRKVPESEQFHVNGNGMVSQRKPSSVKMDDSPIGYNESLTESSKQHANTKLKDPVRKISVSTNESKLSNEKQSIVSMFETIAVEETINKKKGEFIRRKSSAQYYRELDELQKNIIKIHTVDRSLDKQVENTSLDEEGENNYPQRKGSVSSYLTASTNINGDNHLNVRDDSRSVVKSRPKSAYLTKGNEFQSIAEEKKEDEGITDEYLLNTKSSFGKETPKRSSSLNEGSTLLDSTSHHTKTPITYKKDEPYTPSLKYKKSLQCNPGFDANQDLQCNPSLDANKSLQCNPGFDADQDLRCNPGFDANKDLQCNPSLNVKSPECNPGFDANTDLQCNPGLNVNMKDLLSAQSPTSSGSESGRKLNNKSCVNDSGSPGRKVSRTYGRSRRTSKSECQFSGQRKSLVNMFENIAAEESVNKKRGEFIRKKSSAQYYKEIQDLVEIKENENVKRTSLLILNSVEPKTEEPLTQKNLVRSYSSEKTFNLVDRRKSEIKNLHPVLSLPVEEIIPISEEAKKVGELLESEADLYSALEKDLHRITADISTVKSDFRVLSTAVQRKASGENGVHANGNKKQTRLQKCDEVYSSASDSELPVHTYLNISESSDTDNGRENSLICNSKWKLGKKSLSSITEPNVDHENERYQEDHCYGVNDVKDDFHRENGVSNGSDQINGCANFKKMKLSRKKAVISMPAPMIASFIATDNNVGNEKLRIPPVGNNNRKMLNLDEANIECQHALDNDSFYSSSASESERYSSYSDSSENINCDSRKQSVVYKGSEDESEELFRLIQNKTQSYNLCNAPDINVERYSSTDSDQSDCDVSRRASVIYKPIEQINRKITLTNEDSTTKDEGKMSSRKGTQCRKGTSANEDSTKVERKVINGKETLSRKSTLTNEDTTMSAERKLTLTQSNLTCLENEGYVEGNDNIHESHEKLSNEMNDKSWINNWVKGKSINNEVTQSNTSNKILCLDDLRKKRTYKCDDVIVEDSDSDVPMRQRYASVNQLDIYEDLRSEGMEVVADKETRDIITDTLSAFNENGICKNTPFRKKLGSEYYTDSDSNSTVIDVDEGCKPSLDVDVKEVFNHQNGKVKSLLYEDQLNADEEKSTTFSTMFGYFNYCLYVFISKEFGLDKWKQIIDGMKLNRKQIVMFEKPKHNIFDDTLTDKVLRRASSILDIDFNLFLQKYGNHYFEFCCSKYGDILKSIATNLADFINNMDDIRRHIHKIEKIADHHPPSIYASVEKNGSLLLYYHSYQDQKYLEYFIIGYLKAAALHLYGMHCDVHLKQKRTDYEDFSVISIKAVSGLTRKPSSPLHQVSTNCEDLVVEPYIMDDIFPFHMILDKHLDMSQIGISLNRLLENYIPIYGLNVKTYFKLIKPAISFCYNAIKNNLNTAFIFSSQDEMFSESFSNGLTLKGQITYLASSGALWFIASPKVDRLSQLNELFLSNIPLHDATREVLLISEQSHAQDTLKSQLQVLTNRLKETSKELALGKINTETILDEIFPKYVAEQLMQNKPVPAVTAEEVTILFTDIVGFTKICGECDPEQITDMLNSLYLEFDVLCEKYEVYKVETIGDAYMAVGGIHRKDAEHGRVTSLMGIEMVDRASKIFTPSGESIEIRVGIHSGSVVAGVVGTRMPRYCLFGNNVTLANKMESTSEARRVHISPATYLEIKHHQEFVFWYRKREVMPPLMQKLYQGNTFFVTQRRPTYFDDTPSETDTRLKYMKTRSIENDEDTDDRRDSFSESVCSEYQDYQKYPEALREQLHALEKINGYETGKLFPSSIS